MFRLPDIPDEEKNGEAADYNDDYEDDFNPTRYRYTMVFALQGVCGQEVLILTEYVSFTFSFETVILAFLKTLMSSYHLVVSTAEVPRFVVRSLSSRRYHNQCHFRDLGPVYMPACPYNLSFHHVYMMGGVTRHMLPHLSGVL